MATACGAVKKRAARVHGAGSGSSVAISSGTWVYRVQAFKGSLFSAYSNQVSVRVR
jgi:hypothetical protein